MQICICVMVRSTLEDSYLFGRIILNLVNVMFLQFCPISERQ